MFSYPYLFDHGYNLYGGFIHPYPPLLTLLLAVSFHIFGFKLIVLRVLAYLFILSNDILIFIILRKLGKTEGFLLAYVILQPFLEGNMLWFDTAIVPFVLLMYLFLIDKKYKSAGFSGTIAIFIKQTSVLFLILSLVFLIFRKAGRKAVLSFIAVPLVIGLFFLSFLFWKGSLTWFLNWTVLYPMTEWGKVAGYVNMRISPRQGIILGLLFLPIFVKLRTVRIGVIGVKDERLSLLLFFLVASILAVYPRFSFFHFQAAFAFLVIILAYLHRKFFTAPLLLPLIAAGVLIVKPGISDFHLPARFYTEEDISFAKIITERTGQMDKVFLLGPHSQIYAMADRLPPAPWTDNFAWYLKIAGVQKDLIASWEKNPAKYIYKTDKGEYFPDEITNWIETNYTKGEEIVRGVTEWKKKI